MFKDWVFGVVSLCVSLSLSGQSAKKTRERERERERGREKKRERENDKQAMAEVAGRRPRQRTPHFVAFSLSPCLEGGRDKAIEWTQGQQASKAGQGKLGAPPFLLSVCLVLCGEREESARKRERERER